MKLSAASTLAALLFFSNALAQRDVTFTITCLGPACTDYPPTTVRIPTSTPTPPPRPTTTSSRTPPKPTTSSTLRTSTTRRTSTRKPPHPTSSKKPDPKPSSTRKRPPTKTTEEVGPSSTRCPVPLYYQCGGYYDGKPWTGCTKCVAGAKCIWQNDWYYQCVADE